MATLLFSVAGGLLAWLVTSAWSRSLPANAPIRRLNYRGLSVPSACGVTVVAGAAVGSMFIATVEQTVGPTRSPAIIMLVSLTSYGLLGLWDDIAGNETTRGWRGHLRSLRAGAPSSGAVKLLGGIAIGFALSASVNDGGIGALIVGAGVVAGMSNLFNLLDLRPARAAKLWLISAAGAAIALAAGGQGRAAMGLVVVGASVAAFIPHELRERAMLGDVGANAIGGALGASVLYAGVRVQSAVLIALVILTALGDRPGLSRIIESFPPLRALDRAGRVRG